MATGKRTKQIGTGNIFKRTRIKLNCLIFKDQFIESTVLLPVKTQSACLWLFKTAREHFFHTLRQAKAISTLPGIKHVWDVLFIRHFFQPHLWMLVAAEVGVYGNLFLGSWGWRFFLCLYFAINRRVNSPRCNTSSPSPICQGVKSEDLISLYTFVFFKLFNFYYCCTIYTITYNFNASIVHFVFSFVFQWVCVGVCDTEWKRNWNCNERRLFHFHWPINRTTGAPNHGHALTCHEKSR